MHSDLRAQAAFRLTGLRPDAGVPGRLLPALAARLRNLAALRYDFPVVLLAKPKGNEVALPLTTLVDRLLEATASDGEGARLRARLLRVERRVREAVAGGATRTAAELWDAARALVSPNMPALGAEGEIVDCDARFAQRFVGHAWKVLEARKAASLREEVDGLAFRLHQLVAADAARSAQGQSAARLRETFGSGDRDSFDFEAMSRLLARSAAKPPLSEKRRQRIASLIASLESGRFFIGEDPEAYSFERCGAALRAFRSRYDAVRAFLRALTMARLEVDGAYDESLHAPLFRQLAESPLSADDLERLPTYFISLRWEELDAAERADVEELLCAGVPARVLVQTDDLLGEKTARAQLGTIASHAHALAGSALGLDDVFVLQAPSSLLPRMQDELLRGLTHRGGTLFSVFSGATGETASLPPYLNGAAALESRVFPAFTYDPSRADGERLPLSLEHNPQPQLEWPVHELDYEDAGLQRARREVAFTPADFVAADTRFARHFLRTNGSGVDEPGATSTILMVDEEDRLRELLVDEQVAIQARRCANRWRHLQRLAARPPAAKPAPVAEAAPPPPIVEAAPKPVPAEQPKAASSDDAYIETPRCTTCNECTQINNRMFAYDGNQQAYIADINAGTYRELVEAAESCQVSIIHPGKPRNAGEPDLEELIGRAEPFR